MPKLIKATVIYSTDSTDSKDSKFFGIVDKKYLKVLSGDFTGEWHVAPAVLGGLVLIVLVFISCLCWKGDTKKR